MSLHSLHERWKLFNRELFKTNLLSSFLFTLIKLLLSANGVLHHDQLINVLFHMGQADTDALYNSFVQYGYMPHTKIIDDIYLAKVSCNHSYRFSNDPIYISYFISYQDFPTFSNKVSQLVQDAKCAQQL